MHTNLQLYATAGSWLEQNALDQAAHLTTLPDVYRTVAFPDLHAGIGGPIGVAAATHSIIYPHIVGNDIGCGMALFATDLEQRSFKTDRVWRSFDRYASFGDIPLDDFGVIPDELTLGTIGGGNHFAEFTVIDKVEDPAALAQLGLAVEQLCLLVHSGSRGLGQAILRQAISQNHAQAGLPADSTGGIWYRQEHDRALAWAERNRRLVACRCLAALGVKDSLRCLTDLVHNGLEAYGSTQDPVWVHRKGAAKADSGVVIIPGSRGSYSYLVQPLAPDDASLYSLAHGAGRKWQRSQAKGKLGGKYTPESIQHTRLDSRVFCRDRSLLFEEAPEAYKNIERVIADLVDFQLVRVIARFRPRLTLKY